MRRVLTLSKYPQSRRDAPGRMGVNALYWTFVPPKTEGLQSGEAR